MLCGSALGYALLCQEGRCGSGCDRRYTPCYSNTLTTDVRTGAEMLESNRNASIYPPHPPVRGRCIVKLSQGLIRHDSGPHTPPPSVKMAAMSLLRSVAASLVRRLQPVQPGRSALLRRAPPAAAVPVRCESHGKRLFVITPSSYYDKRFLRLLKFYVLLTAVPAGIAITLINIFIGPAELVEIPEDYVPEYWEYYRHPITRFLARNIYQDYQQSYEQTMCLVHVENEKRLLRLYETAARRSMRQNGDGPWFQYETLDKNLIDNGQKAVPDE